MEKPHQYESERESCTKLKAEIVSCMTDQVKLKIADYGYTPSQIATAYILKKMMNQDHDDQQDILPGLNLIDTDTIPNYKSMIYNNFHTEIIDIIF